MFNRIKKYITGSLFISLFFMPGICFSQAEGGNILIINSYNNNIKWSTEVSDTITKSLARYAPQLKIEEIDLGYNEHPGKSYRNSAEEIIRRTAENIPDIVILIGDPAEIVYNTELVKIPEWSVVKSLAVNTRNSRLHGTIHGTGVGFQIPVKDNIGLIRTMVPGLNEILWVDKKYRNSDKLIKEIEDEIASRGIKIKLNVLYVTGNIESLYKTILENKPGRAILTGSWNFLDKNSSYTKKEVDSLLSNKLTSPVFSLFVNYYNNSYLVGGYNLSARICAEKIVEQTKKLLNGIHPSQIPFEQVINGDILLNKSALEKFGMESYTRNYFEVKYVNVKPSFLEIYKYELIVYTSAFVLLIIIMLFLRKKSKENKIIRKNLMKIKERFAFLNEIYENINLNFAVYGNTGEKIIEGISHDVENNIAKEFLPQNIFKAEFITKEDAGAIRGKKSMSREYNSTILEKYSGLNPVEGRVISFTIKPIQTPANDSYKYIAITSDVTRTQTDLMAKETLNTLIKSVSEITNMGVSCYNILNGKGFATNNWFNNLGEKNTGAVIQPDYANCSTEDKAKIIDFKQDLLNAKASRLGLDMKVYNSATGKERWIRENIFLHEYDPNSGIIEVIDINFDINKEKTKEINLINLNKKAESVNIDNDRFISSISHEIRTPLNSIIGFSNMLTGLSDTGDKSDRDEIVCIIKRNNVILIELINNILSIARIDSGTCNFEKTKIELNEFFQELKIATAHMVAGEKQVADKDIDIVCDIPEQPHIIFTDEWNFRQIMINLLSNAVKFTQQGAITFGYQPQEEGFYFYVKDTGCGIALENQERIFNRFEKIETHTSGSGLGLSLCKSIVHHLNGEIGVISKEGEGSTFWFILKTESA